MFRNLIRWFGKASRAAGLLLLIAWASLAIYYSNLPWPTGRLLLTAAFAGYAVWALWLTRRPKMKRVFAGVYSAVVIWWLLIPPSHNRPWRLEVGELPQAIIETDNDTVRLANYRHFKFRSRNDFDVNYEEREFQISRVVSIDLFISYWKLGPVAHTFLSFNFDDGSPPLCISIETRPEEGEGFDPLASMFKQFELAYVVGDERDMVRVRTDHRNEDVFMYRTRATPEAAQQLLRIYLERINELYERPEWYHLISNSCTINVIRYSRKVGGAHRKLEIKHFLNGWIDAYLYRLGILETGLGFEELRRRSHINATARAIGDTEDFSQRLRKSLPARASSEENSGSLAPGA